MATILFLRTQTAAGITMKQHNVERFTLLAHSRHRYELKLMVPKGSRFQWRSAELHSDYWG